MSAADGEEPSFGEKKAARLAETAHSKQLDDIFEDTQVEYLREMVKTKLDPGTVSVLDNYVSPDFVLGNDRERDYHEFKYQLEAKIIRVFEMHPPEGGVGGKERAAYYNDPRDILSPLRPDQRELIRTYKDGILTRRRRSVGGFQQEKIGETTSRVETIQNEEENGKRGRGLFG